jgi:hypothetical protein
LLSGVLMLADASLYGASLGRTLGLADALLELELELIQTQMTHKPMLRAEKECACVHAWKLGTV